MAIKEADLKEWSDLEARRSALQRELTTVKDRQGQIEEQLEAELRKSGKTKITRSGFTLALKPGKANVSWAKEYLKALGKEAVQKLKNAAAQTSVKVFVLVPPKAPKE
jgi:predicted  nucleic acid-binding Zn-ribbon protein